MNFNDAFIEPVAPLGSDLEWMLQSDQVSDQALAERLVLDYHARAVALALVTLGDEKLAEQAASAALKEMVQDRRKYWGNESLQAWIYAHLVRHVQRRANWSWRWRRGIDRNKLEKLDLDNETRLRRKLLGLDVHRLLPLSLVFGHDLTAAEAATAMNLPEEEFNTLLTQARSQAFALEDGELAQMLALHTHFEPEGNTDEEPAGEAKVEPHTPSASGIERFYRRMVSQVALGLAHEGRRRSWRRLAGEIVLGAVGVCLALIIGINALGQEPVVTSQVTYQVVYITRTPEPGQDGLLESSSRVIPYGSQPDSTSNSVSFPTPRPTSTPAPRQAELDLTEALADFPSPGSNLMSYANSGPFTLSLLLRYLGQASTFQELSDLLRPNPMDTGIFPYEIEEFIFNTPLRANYRFGGDLGTLRRLIDSDLPVLLQLSYLDDDISGWTAEYALLFGYDDFNQQVHLVRTGAEQVWVPYEEFLKSWLPFGYAYFVIYPAERSGVISQALERDFSVMNNFNYSLSQLASENPESDLEQFWILVSQGTILTFQSDYANAAQVFDSAFEIYQALPEADRPWRVLWFNSRPYWAYFYSGQYSKVIAMTDDTIGAAPDIVLEESLYWRALAYEALGNLDKAMSTLRQALEFNPNFAPGKYQLERLQSGG